MRSYRRYHWRCHCRRHGYRHGHPVGRVVVPETPELWGRTTVTAAGRITSPSSSDGRILQFPDVSGLDRGA